LCGVFRGHCPLEQYSRETFLLFLLPPFCSPLPRGTVKWCLLGLPLTSLRLTSHSAGSVFNWSHLHSLLPVPSSSQALVPLPRVCAVCLLPSWFPYPLFPLLLFVVFACPLLFPPLPLTRWLFFPGLLTVAFFLPVFAGVFVRTFSAPRYFKLRPFLSEENQF